MGFFSFFSKEKKETLDKGLSKTKESVFGKIARAVAGAQCLSIVGGGDSVSAVSDSEEAQAVMEYNKALQANMKVIQTANSIFDTILAAV